MDNKQETEQCINSLKTALSTIYNYESDDAKDYVLQLCCAAGIVDAAHVHITTNVMCEILDKAKAYMCDSAIYMALESKVQHTELIKLCKEHTKNCSIYLYNQIDNLLAEDNDQ